MTPVVADQQILQGVSATLQVTLTDQNGTAADASGAVTVGVTKADGTVVLAAGTATTHGATGVYSVALVASKTVTLEWLTATWTDAGDGSVNTTLIEIVGGFFFSIADARASDTTLADVTKYPDATVLAKRTDTEAECEEICDVAFVPRYRRVTLDGSGLKDLVLPDNVIRTVRSVRTITNMTTGTYTAFTTAQLAALAVSDNGTISRTDFGNFIEGRSNIVVEYEHGITRPPADLKTAAMVRLLSRINMAKSGIPDRASSFVADGGGGTFRLDVADTYKTGIPDVDAAYGRYSLRSQNGVTKPAGRAMHLNPQFYSVFHGGPR